MSDPTNKFPDSSGDSSPPPWAVRASPKLRQNVFGFMLFKILYQAWKHLNKELCPRDAKSVWTKACDVIRNVKLWRCKVGEMLMSGNGARDHSGEFVVADKVVMAAELTIQNLEELVNKQAPECDLVEQELHRFKVAVRSALGHLDDDRQTNPT